MNHTIHDHTPDEGSPRSHAHTGHKWMMIACCVPMLVIAVALVATGVAGVGFIFAAIVCTLMMAMLMRGMHGGSGDRKS